MKNFNTLAKSFKSMKIVKMIDNGVSKLAKLLHLKSKILYMILGLLAAILLAMGLGKKKEGFDSASDAERPLASTVDNMNSAINYIVGWATPAEKQGFIDSVNSWWKQKMLYLIVQGGIDLQTYDINKNNKIYQLNADMVGEKDSLGNVLVRYIDDNMTTPPSPEFLKKYTLITLNDPTNRYITQAELDRLYTQIDTKIKSFGGPDPTGMSRLQTAYTAMITYANQFGVYALKNPRIKLTALFYSNILGQGSKSNGAAWGQRGGGGGYGASYQVGSSGDLYRGDLYSGYVPGGELDQSYGRGSGGYMRPGGGSGLSGDSVSQQTNGSVSQQTNGSVGQCGDGNMTNIPIQCINSIYEKSQCSAANLPFNRPSTIPVEGFPYNMVLSDTSLDISQLPGMNWSSFQSTILPKVVNLMCGGGGQQQPAVVQPAVVQPATVTNGGSVFGGQSVSSAGVSTNSSTVSTIGQSTSTTTSTTSPASITQANIPPGAQDMYMLKTQALPTNPPGSTNPNPSPTSNCIKPTPVPPCPPCERCPEPAFDCKRVPNYNSKAINQYIPQPVLADFSQFGM